MSPRSGRLYGLLFESSPDLIWILEDMVFIDANPAAVKSLGYDSVEEMIGLTPWGISPDTQPDGTSSRQKAEQYVSEAMKTGHVTFEWLYQKRNGSPLYCELTLRSQTMDGKIIILAIGRDITELKRAEEEHRQYVKDIERFNRIAVGRENRILDLQREINELAQASGKPPRYDLSFVEHELPEVETGAEEAEAENPSDTSIEKLDLRDLVDLRQMQHLMDIFCDVLGIGSAILDIKGNILIKSHWMSICANFHRVREKTCIRCVESDTELAKQMMQGEPYAVYECKNGLTDAASPIIIEGKHLANVFIGQFLLRSPDEDFFRRQAAEMGFNEAEYIKALRQVTVIEKGKLPTILDFLTSMANLIADQGLQKIRMTRADSELRKKADVLMKTIQELEKQRLAAISLAADADSARITAENARAELAEAEERYRSLVENSPAGIFLHQEGVISYVNPSMANILGYKPDEIIGRNLVDLIAPEDKGWVINRAEQRCHTGKPFAPSTHFIKGIHRDGRIIDMEVGQSDVRMRGKIAVLGTVLDVTERKKAEEALRRSEEKYRELVQNANSIIVRWDSDGIIGFFNEYAQSFFGYSEEEILGKNVTDTIVPKTETSGRDLVALMEDIRKHPEQHESVVNENIRKNGERVWVAWTNKPVLDESGKLKEVFSVGVDLTERKRAGEALEESEERYRAIFNSNAVALILFDVDGRIADINSKMCEMHGYSRDEMIGMPGTNLVDPRYHFLIDELTQMRMGEWFEAESVDLRKDGSPFDVEVYGTRIRYRGKELLSAVIRDVTERNKAREVMQLYTDVVRNMQVGLYIYQLEDLADDRTFRLTAVNPESAAAIGLAEEEMLGKYLDEILPGLRKHGIISLFANVVRNGRPFNVDDFAYSDDRLGDKHYSFRAFCVPGNRLGVLIEDITDVKRAEEEKKQFYRETISSVTDGKLQIVGSAELKPLIRRSAFEAGVSSYADITTVRKPLENYFRELGVSEDKLSLFSIAVGEAMTNAVKHAGGGLVFAGSRKSELWVGVRDRGPGISALVLPNATLRRGYSTKVSMGMGYSIMLEAADLIMLSTGPKGTTVALFLNLQPAEHAIPLAAIPDTWDSI